MGQSFQCYICSSEIQASPVSMNCLGSLVFDGLICPGQNDLRNPSALDTFQLIKCA
jgi:hypothetical protein